MMNTSHLQYSQMTVCKTFFKQFDIQIKQIKEILVEGTINIQETYKYYIDNYHIMYK